MRRLIVTDWAGERFGVDVRPTNAPPRAARVPSTATDVRYYLARVADSSGCEPRGTVSLEVWRVPGGASEWSSVSAHSRATVIEGALRQTDTLADLWTWRDGGQSRTYVAATRRRLRTVPETDEDSEPVVTL